MTATRRPLCDYTIPAHENAQLKCKNSALYTITGSENVNSICRLLCMPCFCCKEAPIRQFFAESTLARLMSGA